MNETFEKISSQIKSKYFDHHCPLTARLNNGSFGSAPNCVLETKNAFFNLYEKQPDDIYFNGIEKLLAQSSERIAKDINCSEDEVVMVDNASLGSIIVAQRTMFDEIKRKDKSQVRYVLHLNIIYGAVLNVVEYYLKPVGIQSLVLHIPFPLQNTANETANQYILRKLEELLQTVPQGSIALAILDHISSVPSILLPISEMVKKCKEYQVEEVFVDGAHAIGQVELDMKEIGADSYVANVHKWSFGPTSCAFFYSKRKDHRDQIPLHHPLTSHNLNQGLKRECAWIGTRDYSSMHSAVAALDFYHRVGSEIYDQLDDDLKKEFEGSPFHKGYEVAWYNRKRVLMAANMLTTYWNTSIAIAEELVTSMCMIELPPLNIHSTADASAFRKKLRTEHYIESVIYYHPDNGKAYLRLSSQIYNSFKDFLRIRDAVALLSERNNVASLN